METQIISLRDQEGLKLSTSQERTELAQAIIQDIQDGNGKADELLVLAKKAIEFFTILEKNLKPIVAAKGIQKGGYELCNGTKIIEKKDPDKFDFTACKDPVWESLNSKLNKLAAEKKERENFLKTLKTPMTETQGDFAGIEFYPPAVVHGAQNIAVTVK